MITVSTRRTGRKYRCDGGCKGFRRNRDGDMPWMMRLDQANPSVCAPAEAARREERGEL